MSAAVGRAGREVMLDKMSWVCKKNKKLESGSITITIEQLKLQPAVLYFYSCANHIMYGI